MYTDNLFTEENLGGMKKLLKRICEGNPDSSEEEVRFCLLAMYDTVNSELIDQRKAESRMEDLADDNAANYTFYIVSALRYTPLIFFSRKDGDETSGPCYVYEGIEGDGVETETMPVYTRRKVANGDFASFHWHHTDFDSVLQMGSDSGFKYIVINPDTTPVLLDIKKTQTIVEFYRDLDDGIAQAMSEGIKAEDLFPALVEKFYFRSAECDFLDGSKKSGLVLVPEDDTASGFELETDDDEDVLVRLEDLASIRATDEEDYEE